MVCLFGKTNTLFLVTLALLIGCGNAQGQGEDEKDLIKKVYEGKHTASVVIFTPDGKHLVLAEHSRKEKNHLEIVLLDPFGGKELRRSAPVPNESFRQGFFSPDGKVLVLEGYRRVLVWDVERWQQKVLLKTLEGHTIGVNPLAVDPAGTVLFGTCITKDDKKTSLVFWDLKTGEPRILVQERWDNGLGWARFLEDAPYILLEYTVGSPRSNRCLFLWDLARNEKLPQELLKIPVHRVQTLLADDVRFARAPSGRLAILPDYQRHHGLVWYHTSRGVYSLRPRARGEAWKFGNFGGSELGHHFAVDGGRFAVCGNEETGAVVKLLVWDLAGLKAHVRKLVTPATPQEREKEWALLFAEPKTTPDGSCWEYEPQMTAHAALLSLVRHPREAVPWLRKRLGAGATPQDLQAVPQWINDLDAPDFNRRNRAGQQLKRLVSASLTPLTAALAGAPLEKRRRLEDILKEGPDPTAYELRLVRVTDALAAMNTPEAQTLLRSIAQGTYGREYAVPAANVLRRLEQKKPGS